MANTTLYNELFKLRKHLDRKFAFTGLTPRILQDITRESENYFRYTLGIRDYVPTFSIGLNSDDIIMGVRETDEQPTGKLAEPPRVGRLILVVADKLFESYELLKNVTADLEIVEEYKNIVITSDGTKYMAASLHNSLAYLKGLAVDLLYVDTCVGNMSDLRQLKPNLAHKPGLFLDYVRLVDHNYRITPQ